MCFTFTGLHSLNHIVFPDFSLFPLDVQPPLSVHMTYQFAEGHSFAKGRSPVCICFTFTIFQSLDRICIPELSSVVSFVLSAAALCAHDTPVCRGAPLRELSLIWMLPSLGSRV